MKEFHSIFPRTRNISAKFVEKIKTHYKFRYLFNNGVYEIIWKNTVEADRPQMTIKIRRMRCACWIPKATRTHNAHTHTHNHPLSHMSYLFIFRCNDVSHIRLDVSFTPTFFCLVWNLTNCQPFINKSVIFWCIDRRCFYSHSELLYVASLLHPCFKCRNTYY